MHLKQYQVESQDISIYCTPAPIMCLQGVPLITCVQFLLLPMSLPLQGQRALCKVITSTCHETPERIRSLVLKVGFTSNHVYQRTSSFFQVFACFHQNSHYVLHRRRIFLLHYCWGCIWTCFTLLRLWSNVSQATPASSLW